MAINSEPNIAPSVFQGISSFSAPSIVLFPAVGNASPIQYPAIVDSILALAREQMIFRPILKIYGSYPTLGLTYGNPSSGIQVTTGPNANSIAERYPLIPGTVAP